jgi:hypothetical protein
MLTINQKAEKIQAEKVQNAHQKSQNHLCRLFKAGMLAVALMAYGVKSAPAGILSGEPQTTRGATDPELPMQPPSQKEYPHELVLYYDAKNGGSITPKDEFSVCTVNTADYCKFKGLNYGKGLVGTLNPAKNPKIPLHLFSMKKWKEMYTASQSSIEDDVVLSISNQGKDPLVVTLPEFIPMRLFIFGHNIIIKNDAHIENGCPIIGFDPRTMIGLSSGCPWYSNPVVPSTVRIRGRLQGNPPLVMGSSVVLEKGVPQNWRLLNARITVLDGQTTNNDGHPFGLQSYGTNRVEFTKTTRMNGEVFLSSDDEPVRTDPSDQPNNGVLTLINAAFAPKTLKVAVPFTKLGGYITVHGPVDLSQTTIVIMNRETGQNTKDIHSIPKHTIIRSDRPIIGVPKITCDPRWKIQCKVDGNALSIMGHKRLSA